MPVYFIWLKYLSWINYSNEIFVINQWNGINNIPGCDPNGQGNCFPNGDAVIKSFGMNKVRFIALF